jgi:hypothetical protein
MRSIEEKRSDERHVRLADRVSALARAVREVKVRRDRITRHGDGMDGNAPDDDTAYVARGIVPRPLVSSGPGAAPSLNQRSPSPIGLRLSM